MCGCVRVCEGAGVCVGVWMECEMTVGGEIGSTSGSSDTPACVLAGLQFKNLSLMRSFALRLTPPNMPHL